MSHIPVSPTGEVLSFTFENFVFVPFFFFFLRLEVRAFPKGRNSSSPFYQCPEPRPFPDHCKGEITRGSSPSRQSPSLPRGCEPARHLPQPLHVFFSNAPPHPSLPSLQILNESSCGNEFFFFFFFKQSIISDINSDAG